MKILMMNDHTRIFFGEMKISTPLMDLLNSNAFKKIKDDYDVVSNNILNDGFMR